MEYLPMLAETAPEPFDSPDFIFEPKWDGYRALYYTKSKVIKSRKGKIMSDTFSHLLKTQLKEAVIDGELVSLVDGRPNFKSLRQNPHTAVLMAFDLLSIGGEDTTNLPLEKRREILKELVQGESLIGFSPDYKDGIMLFNALKQSNWEGVMAKRKGSIYTPGKRSNDWLKVIAYKEVDAVLMEVVRDKGTALLGLFKDGKLIPIGHIHFNKSFSDVKGLQVVTVRYREYTGESLRHASLVRLRDDKSPKECTYEQLIQSD